MTYYPISVTTLVSVLAIIWTRKDWFNVLVKTGLILLAGWGWIIVLISVGYIVKQ